MEKNKAPIQCSMCQETFATKYSLLRHTGRRHVHFKISITTPKNHDITGKNHDRTGENHDRTGENHDESSSTTIDSDTQKHTCLLCHKKFTRKWSLTKHMENCKGVVNKKDKLQCEYCEKEFKHERSRFYHYKICATKKEVDFIEAEEKETKPKTINNSGQTNNLTNGIQNINNNTNNNIIIVYNPTGNTPFSTEHLKAIDFKKILRLAKNNLDNRALEEFSKQVFENERNRCIRKTNIKLGHSKIHVGDNKWKLQLDKNIYPKLALDMANNMSEYVDEKRETFKKDMYIRLRDFVDCMCDAGYINPDPTAREKELQREFKTFTDGLKLIVYGNTVEP